MKPTDRELPRPPRKGGLRRTFVLGPIFLAVSAGMVGLLWKQGSLKRWLQARVVEYYLKQVQPHIPFKIEEIEADAPLADLLYGRLKNISAALRWKNFRMRVNGPIEITRPTPKEQTYSVKFDAQATLEPTEDSSLRSTPFELDLYAKATDTFSQLTDLELFIGSHQWTWPLFKVTAEQPDIAVAWSATPSAEGEHVEAAVSFKKFEWTPNLERHVTVRDGIASARLPLHLKPFSLGPDSQATWKASRAQINWDSLKLDLPLSQLPIQVAARLEPPTPAKVPTNPAIRSINATVGPVQLSLTDQTLQWKTPKLPIRPLISQILMSSKNSSYPYAPPPWLRKLNVRAGTLESEGSIRLDALSSTQKPDLRGVLRVRNGAVQQQADSFAARGIELDLPFSTQHGIQGVVSAKDLFYRKAHGKLETTELTLELNDGVRMRLGTSGRDGTPPHTPLLLDEVPLTLGPIHARFSPFELETSLELPPVAITKVTQPFCVLNHLNLPPALIEASLTQINLSPGAIDPEGQITAHLFDGTIRAQEIGLYDLDSPVPEVDFDLDFKGIQLDPLCQWSGFGEMIGSLQGFAHDVTFQGWLPTHFDLSFDAIPRPPSTWIEMDPEAMHNLVSLFAGDALENVPVIAHGGLFNKTFDPYFGWISRRLGGFDLKYFGLSLYSTNGAILLETHDPPEIFRKMKKHYIFWGHRFKMPVQSKHYPVVMDEHGVARIFQFMVERAKAIAGAKRAKDDPRKNQVGEAGNADRHKRNKEDGNAEYGEYDDESNGDPSCKPPLF